jgi:glycosyltransferase involved in cell wall biosynthesis
MMLHNEVAVALQDALIYLSCGHPEGFGLPLAEAIACGCMVVGYHGLAGRDFALPHMKVVEFGDLLGLLQGIKNELARFDANREQVIQERLEASRLILKRYSLEEEQACCLKTWSQLCP